MILASVANKRVAGPIRPSTNVALKVLWLVEVRVGHMTLKRPRSCKSFSADFAIWCTTCWFAPRCLCNQGGELRLGHIYTHIQARNILLKKFVSFTNRIISYLNDWSETKYTSTNNNKYLQEKLFRNPKNLIF